MTAGTVRYALVAQVFAALAHTERLEIIRQLDTGQHTARELADLLGLTRARVFRQLGVLKARGLVLSNRCANVCGYRLSSPQVVVACEVVRQLILKQLDSGTCHRPGSANVVPLRKERS